MTIKKTGVKEKFQGNYFNAISNANATLLSFDQSESNQGKAENVFIMV